MATYDLKAHIDELAREHLDRRDRSRLCPLLESACTILRPSETPLRLSDAYLDERFGLLVLCDRRHRPMEARTHIGPLVPAAHRRFGAGASPASRRPLCRLAVDS